MEHSIEELIAVAYRHYPVGIWDENPAYRTSPEHQCLRAAIDSSGRFDPQWQRVLDRLAVRFKDCIAEEQTYMYIPSSRDVCYYGRLLLPESPNQLQLVVVGLVSILVPYYFLFCKTTLPDGSMASRIRYEPMVIEEPYFRGFASEIESAFGYERMPPEVGLAIAPHVIAGNQTFGTATLYDCLFTDHRW